MTTNEAGTPPDRGTPHRRTSRATRTALCCLFGAWAGWITCSVVALAGAPGGWPSYAGAYDVIVLAITGNSTVAWALWGSRVFGLAMVLGVLGLLVRYVAKDKETGR
ncbi:hypothetical protein ACQHIV_39485 [Kribbella sp. GL6]|uniref:hypothetical protein n=1 Tax=Kribbella sp. GL6 TaxID=3419765 RepID=UPI003D067589